MKLHIISVGWFFGGWAALWSNNVIKGCTWQTVANHHLKDFA